MKLSKNELSAFANAELNTFDFSGLELDKSIALASLEKDLVEEFNDLNLLETKQARLNHFNIPGVNLDDYSELLVDTGEKEGVSRKVICGIRHEGGNIDLPFVQVIPNFSTSIEELHQIYLKFLEPMFKVFRPLHLKFWSRTAQQGCLIGARYLVSDCEKISSLEEWPWEKSIRFEDIKDDSYYEWYESSYNDFHLNNAALKDRVTINSRELMQDSIDEDLLKMFFINGERVGLIAGERSDFLGHPGLYFNEILVSADYKGRGIAKAAQRKFVAEFGERKAFVWGTIDAQNIPSSKTAMANGRECIRFECFLKI